MLFEAPGRAAATLGDLAAACDPKRVGAVCRELTKIHEQIVRGSLAELAEALEPGGSIPARGEFVIVVGMGDPVLAVESGPGGPGDPLTAARAEVQRLVEGGAARGDAARRVGATTGIPRRQLYSIADAPDAPDQTED